MHVRYHARERFAARTSDVPETETLDSLYEAERPGVHRR
jgi:hypothetical protein